MRLFKYFWKPVFKGFSFLLLVLLVYSCKKEEKDNCYICTHTYTITTDVPVSGYPHTESIDNELCDITPEEVATFEQVNTGSDTVTLSGVTYTEYRSMVCRPK